MDTFDLKALANHPDMQEIARTSMRKVGPKVFAALQRVISSDNPDTGDQALAAQGAQAVGAILGALGIMVTGGYGNQTNFQIDQFLLALLTSDAVLLADPPLTYEAVKAGALDGSIRPGVDAVLLAYLQEMTQVLQMTAPAQATIATAVQA